MEQATTTTTTTAAGDRAAGGAATHRRGRHAAEVGPAQPVPAARRVGDRVGRRRAGRHPARRDGRARPGGCSTRRAPRRQGARTEQLRTVGDLTSQNVEALLSAGELSAVRRVLSETGAAYNLSDCRVVLSDGQVVAASNPSQITAHKLPDTWRRTRPLDDAIVDAPEGSLALHYPLRVAGRGEADLQILAPLSQAGVGPVGGADRRRRDRRRRDGRPAADLPRHAVAHPGGRLDPRGPARPRGGRDLARRS